MGVCVHVYVRVNMVLSFIEVLSRTCAYLAVWLVGQCVLVRIRNLESLYASLVLKVIRAVVPIMLQARKHAIVGKGLRARMTECSRPILCTSGIGF